MHLKDWENRLKPYLSQIKLLAEIPLSQTEHAELEKALRDFVQKHGLTEATCQLQRDYPAAFVTYLAFKAAFNEDRGFWDKVAQAIGVDNSSPLFHSSHHWGKTFLEIIGTYRLPAFSGVSGLEYVTPIRLHGGIPAFSLPDFFKHILLPSVQDNRYVGLDDEAALAALLEHYRVELFVDDIVRYFFQHGGERAQRFFSKCRQMAHLAIQGDPLPSGEQLGLRPYVLQAFENYLQNPPEPSQRRRLPRLFFQPYDPGFRLILPAQPVSLEDAGYPYLWRICLIHNGNEIFTDEIKVRVRRSGQEWQTEEKESLLTEPAEYVQVSLICQDQGERVILKRSLRLLPVEGGIPLLAFRYEDGAPRPAAPSLPAQVIWLFYPSGVKLHFEGTARQIAVLNPFASPWQEWQAQAWDLTKVRLIRLLRNGQDICPPIPVSVAYEPRLEGQPVHPQSLPVEEKPLFLGAPRLRLPLRNIQHPQAELEDWHLTLESRYVAQPSGKWEGTASVLTYQIQAEEGYVLLDLSTWLGKRPIGTYHLLARGAAKTEITLPFRTWHDIRIEGLQSYYLPGSQGSEEVCFRIHLPAECQLSVTQESVCIEKTPRGWQVRVAANAHQAYLALEYPQQPETVRVPLTLFIPRLRWALQLDSSSLEWQSVPLRLPLAQLLQSHAPRLRIELPLMGETAPLIALHLKAPGQSEPLQSTESIEIERARHSLECRLDSFFDTLRAHGEQSILDFVLELLDTSRELLTALPVLRLTQELDVRVCYFEPLNGSWRIHWYEPRPLRHRRLRLWSLWQPWADAVEICLPDDAPASDSAPAAGWWMVDLPDEISLPPAAYKVQFLAAAPEEVPSLPEEPPENAISVELIDPKDRLMQIEQELQCHPVRAFALHAEKACIFDAQNRIEERDKEVRWCVSHWNEGSLLHLFGFQRWLASRDANTRRAFLMHMFRLDSLEKLQMHSGGFVEKYLSLIQEAKTIKPESAWLILKMAKAPYIIFKALQTLIQSKDAQAVEYIFQEIQAGRFSETDAAQILSVQPDFAFEQILQHEHSSAQKRLLIELTRKHPRPDLVVWVGYWVKCEAGWGIIIKIEDSEYQEAFLSIEETPKLEVSLWDGTSASTRVTIDVEKGILYSNKSFYLCGCGKFLAPGGKNYQELWNIHRKQCHLTEKWSLAARPFSLRLGLEFSRTKPEDFVF